MQHDPAHAVPGEHGVVAVIPSRMASTRFPGKPLAAASGKPMVQHVHERASAARLVDKVLVATSDPEIIEAVDAFGGEAVMTDPGHTNGTSRIAEVAEGLSCEIIVNVQGDEPMIDPETIDLVVQALRDDPDSPMATAACPFADEEDPNDPNLVKVVHDENGRAITFSRARLDPGHREAAPGDSDELRHIGLYAYRRGFLPEFTAMPPTPLERTERLEQMRVLEHGRPITVARCAWAHHGIDTPEQYEAFLAHCRAQD